MKKIIPRSSLGSGLTLVPTRKKTLGVIRKKRLSEPQYSWRHHEKVATRVFCEVGSRFRCKLAAAITAVDPHFQEVFPRFHTYTGKTFDRFIGAIYQRLDKRIRYTKERNATYESEIMAEAKGVAARIMDACRRAGIAPKEDNLQSPGESATESTRLNTMLRTAFTTPDEGQAVRAALATISVSSMLKRNPTT